MSAPPGRGSGRIGDGSGKLGSGRLARGRLWCGWLARGGQSGADAFLGLRGGGSFPMAVKHRRSAPRPFQAWGRQALAGLRRDGVGRAQETVRVLGIAQRWAPRDGWKTSIWIPHIRLEEVGVQGLARWGDAGRDENIGRTPRGKDNAARFTVQGPLGQGLLQTPSVSTVVCILLLVLVWASDGRPPQFS
ncbi:hypothetical protein FIBSPDRAFT_904306 [Athelia psychrophila]|uniref:Uncharacterized protein n=1 Tax=Athelia psychrophila TaxID=1759441 RepID=A0A167UX55_9AGAM|nr:hypothetical protein FIBSPDRAFT_904306 [Fibularhizoctonia sp. CBS 109695]